MMHSSKLINLPVKTKSNDQLGHVSNVEIDEITKEINKIEVKSGLIFNKTTLLIDKEQIVSISEKEIIVKDTTTKIIEEKKSKQALNEPATAVNCQRQ